MRINPGKSPWHGFYAMTFHKGPLAEVCPEYGDMEHYVKGWLAGCAKYWPVPPHLIQLNGDDVRIVFDKESVEAGYDVSKPVPRESHE